METKSQRPLGISLLGGFHAVAGPLCMVVAVASSNGAQGAILFAAGIYALAVRIGLLRLRSWARPVAIGGYVLNTIGGVAQPNPIAVVITMLLIAYLCSAKVKAAFAPHVLAATPAPTGTVQGVPRFHISRGLDRLHLCRALTARTIQQAITRVPLAIAGHCLTITLRTGRCSRCLPTSMFSPASPGRTLSASDLLWLSCATRAFRSGSRRPRSTTSRASLAPSKKASFIRRRFWLFTPADTLSAPPASGNCERPSPPPNSRASLHGASS